MSKRLRESVFHGDASCQAVKGDGSPCCNGAYFASASGLLVCGMHARGKAGAVELPKRSALAKAAADDAKYAAHMATVTAAPVAGTKGTVILTKLRMMHSPPLLPGVLNIFPNFKHAGRKDGLGLRTLSPMYLGPIAGALNLENFHQGSKCLVSELALPAGIDADALTAAELFAYDPTPAFWEARAAMFADPMPHRHKQPKQRGGTAYFVWVDAEGKVHKLGYVASRQFYCTFYEQLVGEQDEFKALTACRDGDTHLNLVGYDARPVESTAAAIEAAYLDPSAPFGHELVLFALLLGERPWRKHATLV